ncbi:YciI family protein [Streptomyces ovatisporus]|uniref:YciI family protein n=1 Tax=Streptomyces ovatisporus TaxID=1128682 RepID=A0ABV9AFC6_9ACTN
MTQYLISFDEAAMTLPEGELLEVAKAAHAVEQEARDAGVWVFGGGLKDHGEASVVGTDGSVSDGPKGDGTGHLGGLAVVDVASRDDAVKWAARIARACRCPQQVREFMPDPTA